MRHRVAMSNKNRARSAAACRSTPRRPLNSRGDSPRRGRTRLVQRFVALLAPDVRLLQPVTPTIVGSDAARREFTRLLAWLPDVHGVVDAWAASGDTILIAWRLRFTLGRAPFELRIVDRLVTRDGVIAEREAYFDSLRFLLATLSRPAAWKGYFCGTAVAFRAATPEGKTARRRVSRAWTVRQARSTLGGEAQSFLSLNCVLVFLLAGALIVVSQQTPSLFRS